MMPESDWIYWTVIVAAQFLGTAWFQRLNRSLLLAADVCVPFAAACGALYFFASVLIPHHAAGGQINLGFAPMLFGLMCMRAFPVAVVAGLMSLLILWHWQRRHVAWERSDWPSD